MAVDGEKNIFLKKTWDDFRPQNLSRWLQRNKNGKVFFSVDPSLAITKFLPIKLERGALSKQPLALTEFEELLSQEVSKVWIACRREAGSELVIDDRDIILVGGCARNFRVDGYGVINPVGFPAKQIEATFEFIFADSGVWNIWGNFLGGNNNFLFSESARAGVETLKKFGKSPANLLIFGFRRSPFFILDHGRASRIFYRGVLDWSPWLFLNLISSSFGVSDFTARSIYDAYVKKETSASVSRSISRILQPAFDSLFSELKKTRLKGEVFVLSDLNLPFLPLSAGRVTVARPPHFSFWNDLGFKIDQKSWPLDANQTFSTLAPFAELYYQEENLPINARIKRRLHWLRQQNTIQYS